MTTIETERLVLRRWRETDIAPLSAINADPEVMRGLDRIISVIQVGNGGSERIAQKLGMRLERETTDPSCDRAVRVYDISKADYLAGPGHP